MKVHAQAGSPRELYNRPQNIFVAELIEAKDEPDEMRTGEGPAATSHKVPQDSGIDSPDGCRVAWFPT